MEHSEMKNLRINGELEIIDEELRQGTKAPCSKAYLLQFIIFHN